MFTETTRRTAMIAATALLGALAVPAAAQVEVEVDPIAYGLNGFSLHAATRVGPTRLNVGTFGIDVPTWLHGNDGWSASMRGAGVKWDYVGASSAGAFAGAEAGYMRFSYTLRSAAETRRRDALSVGVRGGYRWFPGAGGLYVAPWVGVSYNFEGADVTIGEAEFERSPVSVFPTVHVGWRF